MIRDITIGQYYAGKSYIHSLDPRLKIIVTFIYMLSLFIFNNWIEYAILGVMLILIVAISKVPIKYIVKGLKPILMLLIFTMLMKILFTQGENTLVSKGIIYISIEGIKEALFLGIRLILLVVETSMLTYTTTPNQLTDGFEAVLRPIKIFGVNVTDLAMMMSIALRFIPLLVEETDRIIKAQMSRGADFENGNIMKKIHNMVPLIVPLFVAAFRRANDLAVAMEARCYNSDIKRTKMKPLIMKSRDYQTIAIVVFSMIVLVIIKIIL